MKKRVVLLLNLALSAGLSSSLFADSMAGSKDRLREAAVNTALDSADMKPWHLVASFELIDTKGHPQQIGTIEEYWVSSSFHKVLYTVGPSTWIEIVNQDGVFRTTAEPEPPELAKLLLREFFHPLPSELARDNGIVVLKQEQVGGVLLDCIKYSQTPIDQPKSVPSLDDPIYCFDRDKGSLRLASIHNVEMFSLTTLGTYAGKSVAMNQTISLGGMVVAKAHLTKLQSEHLSESDFVPGPVLAKVADVPPEIPSHATIAKWVKKIQPAYPLSAKQDHVSGTVLLHAVIGSDGHVLSLEPIYSPRYDLTDAATKAVSQWIYEPYLVNGTARAVDTEITVHFSFFGR